MTMFVVMVMALKSNAPSLPVLPLLTCALHIGGSSAITPRIVNDICCKILRFTGCPFIDLEFVIPRSKTEEVVNPLVPEQTRVNVSTESLSVRPFGRVS